VESVVDSVDDEGEVEAVSSARAIPLLLATATPKPSARAKPLIRRMLSPTSTQDETLDLAGMCRPFDLCHNPIMTPTIEAANRQGASS
jgi:hypothetical protein